MSAAQSMDDYAKSLTFKVDGRVHVKPGKKFPAGKGPYGIGKHRVEPVSPSGHYAPEAFISVVAEPVTKGPFRLLHTDPDAFFRRIVRQVFNEMPLA